MKGGEAHSFLSIQNEFETDKQNTPPQTPLKQLSERRQIIEKNNIQVPIHLKAALTIKEAAEYSNIGINKIDQLLRKPNCTFVLFVGTKKLVKRKAFEDFIQNTLII